MAIATAKELFLERYNEIARLHANLWNRQLKIQEEVTNTGKQLAALKEEEITADGLTELLDQKAQLRSKQFTLVEELKTLRETYERVQKQGGLNHLLSKDEKLKEAASDVYQGLLAEAKKDESVREKLEKRYEKAIDELLQLEEERQAFNSKYDKARGLYGKVSDALKGGVNLSPIKKAYTFKKVDAYIHLGKLKNFLKG